MGWSPGDSGLLDGGAPSALPEGDCHIPDTGVEDIVSIVVAAAVFGGEIDELATLLGGLMVTSLRGTGRPLHVLLGASGAARWRTIGSGVGDALQVDTFG